MKTDTREQLDQFWAHELGVPSGLGGTPRLCCMVQHLYPGVQLFSNGERLILASPPAWAEVLHEAIVGVSPVDIFSVAWLQRVFANNAERILGPAEVHYADDTSFRAALNPHGRALSTADVPVYRELVAALDPKEVEESGVSAEAVPAFGAFCDDRLCAVASYQVWQPSIAHISVATHPDHRRHGFAKAAVQALAAEALDRGLILQWRAVAWNTNSLALARSLGFAYYCSTLYVRLRNTDEGRAP